MGLGRSAPSQFAERFLVKQPPQQREHPQQQGAPVQRNPATYKTKPWEMVTNQQTGLKHQDKHELAQGYWTCNRKEKFFWQKLIMTKRATPSNVV